jgi:hypothetical protein
MLVKKAKLFTACLFALGFMFFSIETSAQVDTTDQDTTTYPDTTTVNPDSLHNQNQSSIIQLDNFEATETYFVIKESGVLPKEQASIRQDKKQITS